MGLYDTIQCEYPLPEASHQDLDFQTKDLECFLGTYTVTRDGRLMRHKGRGRFGLDRDIEWPLHGDLRMYTSLNREWIEYVVRFTHGRVEWIRPHEEVRNDPELTPPEGEPEPLDLSHLDALLKPGKSVEPEPETPPAAAPTPTEEQAPPSAEEALLQSLQRDRPELEKLLEKCNDEWGYEDPVYRFYHQSFKVYYLQRSTESIVARLKALAPDLPLTPWFEEIVRSGTGKQWKPEDNQRWTAETRPILEAFFHARYFLEMAVRYGDRQFLPQVLPSGYAALLCLYGLR